MTTTHERGRLGNKIIRNLAVSLIAEKNDLKVNYSSKNIINKLEINLFSGNNDHTTTHVLDDNNFFNLYNSKNLTYNLNSNNNYFQTKDISNFIYKYLQKDIIKLSIIEKNPFNKRYNSNNDLFIHIKLSDASSCNPGINYYINTIKNIDFDTLYIATDEKKHNIIKEIIIIYPNSKIIDYDEVETIQFGSTCKNIILSHGSFSAIIGYLSFFSKIYYPEYNLDKMWHGDIFSIEGWIKCDVIK